MNEQTFQAVEIEGRGATTIWQNRIAGYGMTRVADAVANPNNWRIHTQDQFDVLDAGLVEVGIVQNIIINTTTGNMVDGHGRILLAMKRGEEFWPTTFVTLTHDEERKVLMILDPIAAMAGVDAEKALSLAEIIDTESDAIKALMDRITEQETAASKQPETTEFNFTRELKETAQYVVFAFDNEFDWNVVVEAFGITAAHSLDSKPGYERKGTGRVLDGKKLLSILGA